MPKEALRLLIVHSEKRSKKGSFNLDPGIVFCAFISVDTKPTQLNTSKTRVLHEENTSKNSLPQHTSPLCINDDHYTRWQKNHKQFLLQTQSC